MSSRLFLSACKSSINTGGLRLAARKTCYPSKTQQLINANNSFTAMYTTNFKNRRNSNLYSGSPLPQSMLQMSMNDAEKKVAIINAKISGGQSKTGTEMAPFLIKNEFLLKNLENLKCPVTEYKEIEEAYDDDDDSVDTSRTKNITRISKTNEKVCKSVIEAIAEGYIPIVLGGDHSLAIGSVTGTATALSNTSQIGLIWIDAHADINTPLTSASGNLHGQPVSFLLYELDKYLPELSAFNWQKPCVSARNLVYIGIRDLDPEETTILKKYKIKAFSMTDIQRFGINEVMAQALEHLTVEGEILPLHVSVDIDALDPWYAPSTGTPVLGGLTLSELMLIGNYVHETGKLRTLDLVEVNPLLKESSKDVEKTVFSATRAILSFFGFNTVGSVNPKYKLPQPFDYVSNI